MARQVSLVIEAELVNLQTILDGLSKSATLANGNLKAHDNLTRSGADLGDLIPLPSWGQGIQRIAQSHCAWNGLHTRLIGAGKLCAITGCHTFEYISHLRYNYQIVNQD
ncbi:MAG: hypothetical protein EOS30_24900 [Mesorhizobium sp.]|nr:hypothetical protein EN746_21460 [Mesorhizobium sp. M8A.F.Ca.ET.023.02.2.1]RWC68486.1 MAG: hypothetical protein EOS30_24900 [Mesorhizobium sp.]